jgi:hypothetical protein
VGDGLQRGPDRRRVEDPDLVAEARQPVHGRPLMLEPERHHPPAVLGGRSSVREMITWTEFERQQPALAEAGRGQLYQIGIGLAFLATVRPDGGPRVHPVCPVISDAGLHLLIVAGPKRQDLRRDGRYALHSETCPPPRQDDGFALAGRAREVTDAAVEGVVRARVLTERDGNVWPGFDSEVVFELGIERALLMLTQADGPFPAGPTIWRPEE